MKKIVTLLLLTPLLLFAKQEANDGKHPFIITNQYDEKQEVADSGEILSEEEAEESPSVAPAPASKPVVKIDFSEVFVGSPAIYSLLILLSMGAIFLWLYTTLRWRVLGARSEQLSNAVRSLLQSRRSNEALLLCKDKRDLLSLMLTAALQRSGKTKGELEEAMSRTVKRVTQASWQRIGILSEIALIAPMLGLMGTVLGMFYAFYDVHRSLDTITKLFDGLGISVATTVAGLIVALLALFLHTYLKHRLIRRLARIETEASALLELIVCQEIIP